MDLTQIKQLQYNKRMGHLDQPLNTDFDVNFTTPTYPRDKILLHACTAYRLRLNVPEPVPPNHPTLYSAYTLIKTLMGDNPQTVIDPTLLTPTQADHNLMASIIAWLPRLTFKALDDSASGFQKKCYDISCKDEVTDNDIPVLAYFPKIYTENMHKNKIVNSSKYCQPGHIGQIDQPIAVQITIQDKKYVDKYETWAYTATSDCNHLVSFLSKNPNLVELKTYIISGKVKRHCKNWHDKTTDETQLNYVKVKHDTLRASYNKSGNTQP